MNSRTAYTVVHQHEGGRERVLFKRPILAPAGGRHGTAEIRDTPHVSIISDAGFTSTDNYYATLLRVRGISSVPR